VVAAPVFQRIAEASLRHLGIPTSINPLPPVLAGRTDPAAAPVVQRSAPAGDVVPAVEPVQVGVMPDLRGYSAREALRVLTRLGATARMEGQGFVVDQAPAAGEPLGSGEVGYLKLGRRAPAPAAPAGSGAR
jgi:cell division protein FtsI (penicillin-binding protein 3)